jgi:hypothetical protein
LLTLVKNAPGIVDTNPVKAVPAAVKLIIDIHAVNRCLHILVICLLLYQAVGDNKGKIQELKEKVEGLLDLKMLKGDVPEAAKEALKKFEEYVILRAPMVII